MLKLEGEHVLYIIGNKKERGFKVIIREGYRICKKVLIIRKWL